MRLAASSLATRATPLGHTHMCAHIHTPEHTEHTRLTAHIEADGEHTKAHKTEC